MSKRFHTLLTVRKTCQILCGAPAAISQHVDPKLGQKYQPKRGCAGSSPDINNIAINSFRVGSFIKPPRLGHIWGDVYKKLTSPNTFLKLLLLNIYLPCTENFTYEYFTYIVK